MRSYHGLRRQMDRFWEEKGLGNEKITFHRFRHCYSSYMDSAEVATVVRAALMGHLNDNVTDDTYTDIEDQRKWDAIAKYSKYMKGVL